MSKECVLQLLKSWEYKNFVKDRDSTAIVLQLLKSWEYKNSEIDTPLNFGFYSYLNLESTKTVCLWFHFLAMFYSYLNLESTKTFFLKKICE